MVQLFQISSILWQYLRPETPWKGGWLGSSWTQVQMWEWWDWSFPGEKKTLNRALSRTRSRYYKQWRFWLWLKIQYCIFIFCNGNFKLCTNRNGSTTDLLRQMKDTVFIRVKLAQGLVCWRGHNDILTKTLNNISWNSKSLSQIIFQFNRLIKGLVTYTVYIIYKQQSHISIAVQQFRNDIPNNIFKVYKIYASDMSYLTLSVTPKNADNFSFELLHE